MRRTLAVLACLALLALPTTPSRAASWHSWTGAPTDVFRTGQYSQGEWVYTNGLRQARGANTDGLERSQYYAAVKPSPADPTSISYDLYNAFTYDFFGAHRAAHNGDFQLPDSLPAGTGEVAEVRLAIDGSDLYVRFLWNSFPKPDAQIATLTFGDGPATAWPHGAKQTGSWQTALTVWGTGGALTHTGTDTAVTTRTGDHVSEARIPLALLPSGPWMLRGGSGLTDPAHRMQYASVPAGTAGSTTPSSGGALSPTNVWGLLFAGDTPWSFDELGQSRQLSAAVTTAGATVDPALLRARTTRLAPVLHGDISRLLHSQLPSKDGITKDRSGALGTPAVTPPLPVPDFNVSYYFNGNLQDYAMHVPSSYDGRRATPLVVYLHGYTGLPEEPFRNPTGLVTAIDRRGWLLASALGRGDWFYRGGTLGEADILEVLADVSKHYRVDPDRIYLMGHSMGGYGTNNIAMHHPDLFAAVAPAEGTDSADLHANLRNTPWFEMTAEEDLDSMGKNAKALYASLSADGYRATLLDYRLKTHEYSSIYDTLPRLLGFFASYTRTTRPAVVTWTRPVGQDNAALGQAYDGAWWLRDVLPAAGVTRPTVTVESLALPHWVVNPAAAKRVDRMVDEGGPTGRTGAELFQTTPVATPAALQADTLKITAVGARSATVRLADANLLQRPRLVLDSHTDKDVQLRLVGEARTLARTVDGVRTGLVRARGGALTVLLPAGSHTVVLSPSPAANPGGSLAGTGAPWALPVLGTLLLIGAVRLRRTS
jgi:pimeloyl-ACP methyl ester carboxylesterase